MSIPTRDELIERTKRDLRAWGVCISPEACADFALSEIRRALVAELEALRRRLGAVTLQDDYTRAAMAATLDARLAALRSTDNGPDLSGHDDFGVRPALESALEQARATEGESDAE